MEAGPSFSIPAHRQPSHSKRSYSQMEGSHRSSSSPLFVRRNTSSAERESPPPVRHFPRIALPPMRPRYAGDGLDFRRPAGNINSNSSTVIDLTDDDASMPSTHATPQPEPTATPYHARPQRLPRYDREIIDLSADTSPPEPSHARLPPAQANHNEQERTQGPPITQSSPEVLFVSERPRSPLTNAPQQQPAPYHQRPEPERPMLDLTVDNDDDVVHVRTTERAGINMFGPQGGAGVAGANRFAVGRVAEFIMGRRAGNGGAAAGNWNLGHFFNYGSNAATFPGEGEEEDEEDAVPILNFAPRAVLRRGQNAIPLGMDYTTIGFGVAFENTPPREPTPKYSPPPDPGVGFTRSPQEDDELICPNCKEELGIGSTDQKKQVWVVKACGHVYCGDCMHNRKKKSKGKAKVTEPLPSQPFSTCRAPGCTKTTNKNQVMQIFL